MRDKIKQKKVIRHKFIEKERMGMNWEKAKQKGVNGQNLKDWTI